MISEGLELLCIEDVILYRVGALLQSRDEHFGEGLECLLRASSGAKLLDHAGAETLPPSSI